MFILPPALSARLLKGVQGTKFPAGGAGGEASCGGGWGGGKQAAGIGHEL